MINIRGITLTVVGFLGILGLASAVLLYGSASEGEQRIY